MQKPEAGTVAVIGRYISNRGARFAAWTEDHEFLFGGCKTIAEAQRRAEFRGYVPLSADAV